MHDKHNNNIINLLFQSYLVTPLFKIVKKDVKLQKKRTTLQVLGPTEGQKKRKI